MKWNTAISTKKDGEVYVRGVALSTLIKERTFSEVAFLLMGGRLPKENELALFNMMLVSAAEHGVEVPSSFAPRVAISVGNPMNAALAAGMLATGDHHGGAIELLAQMLASKRPAEELVDEMLGQGGRMPGFGHKIYKDIDPRAAVLLAKAEELGLAGAYVEELRAMHETLESRGKTLPINIDGALAALMCELGLDYRLGKGLFAFARMPGMMAHALEEAQNEKPYRRFDEGDTEYSGPAI